MKIEVYPSVKNAFLPEEVECESWRRVDAFTISILYPSNEDGSTTYQVWQSQDCPIEVREIEV